MLSSHLQTRIVEFDTQIAKSKEQPTPIDLLRRRNSILPISRLPPELIVSILKPTIDASWKPTFLTFLHNNSMCCSPDLIKLTHIYSYWRDVAVAYPALWSFICMANVERFNTFLDRSKDYPLYIDTWSCQSLVDYDRMLQRLAANMHRIHSLRIHPEPVFRGLGETPTNGGHNSRVPDSGGDTASRDRGGLPVAIWHRHLSHLPALAVLVLECPDPKYGVDILKACPAIRRLFIKSCSASEDAVESITLPDLSYLQLNEVDLSVFSRLNLPSLQRVVIRQRIFQHGVPPFFRLLERMIRSDNLKRATDGSHTLFVGTSDEFETVVKIEDTAGNTVVRVDNKFLATRRHYLGHSAFHCLMKQLPQFTASLNIRIQAVGLGNTQRRHEYYTRYVLVYLHAVTSVHILHIKGIHLLQWFLFSINEQLPLLCNNACLKQTSRNACVLFPGLKTIVLWDIGTESGFDATGTWNSFVDWLGGRRQQGLGIEKLTFFQSRIEHLDSEIVDKIRQEVGKVVVEK
ncbi:hypothetical protein AX16_007601 [Volvariella volvacea WC 439]|nr:hypothetical protein AX16_007601 [Volvariella volvacea WC 439]